MSIILDALKKAQEERKKTTKTGFPKTGSGKSSKNQKPAFYIIAGGLVCLITAVQNTTKSLITSNKINPLDG